MKVFWSWQSDTHGASGRHFVREALTTAIAEIVAENTLIDADRPETETETDLQLDHDRKGVAGSPDLFALITDKIRGATVFVADVTPVGVTVDGKKKLMNPNVAIELGVALQSLGTNRVLLVMNTAYGSHLDMPFDLRHKAGLIGYHLPREADKTELRRQAAMLVGLLKTAIAEVIEYHKPPPPPPIPFDAGADWATRPTFMDGDNLEVVESHPLGAYPRSIPTPKTHRLFLRVYPRFVVQERSIDELLELLRKNFPVRPLYWDISNYGRDSVGAIIYSTNNLEPRTCLGAVKVFSSGQIWATSYYQSLNQENAVMLGYLVNELATKFADYSNFIRETWQAVKDVEIIAGLTDISGCQAWAPAITGAYTPQGNGMHDQIVWKGTAPSNQPPEQALAQFAQKAWQTFGLRSMPIQLKR